MQKAIRLILELCLSTSVTKYNDEQNFHVAPMQGYTNASTRYLFHGLSPTSIQWTEMEKVEDLMPTGSRNDLQSALIKRLGPPSQYTEGNHLVLQLGGNDPKTIRHCVEKSLDLYNFREINLNCGCPSIESGGASTFGASLMKNVELTSRLVESIKSGGSGFDVSVKCRIAVMDSVEDMHDLKDDDYSYLHRYVEAIKKAGADHVILHARPAILTGLSPVKNRSVPNLNYDFVQKIAQEFPEMRITLNGGIKSSEDLKDMRLKYGPNIDGFMAGRWLLRRPLDLVCVESQLRNKTLHHLNTVQSAIDSYGERVIQSITNKEQNIPLSELCLPLYLVIEQLKEDYTRDEDDSVCLSESPALLNHIEIESLYEDLQNIICEIESIKSGKAVHRNADCNFKKLTSSLKGIVGTKVFNKWKRNRLELQ
jgi:tRNA dihydrouridine synthase A